jgi:hypothetical protein
MRCSGHNAGREITLRCGLVSNPERHVRFPTQTKMPSPRDLLHRLFEYIGEQLKDIDLRGYRLSSHTGFLRRRGDLAGLPGIEFIA